MASALDVFQVIVEGALLAQRILSVYQFILADTTPDADVVEDLSERMTDLYPTTLLATMADNYVLESLYIKNLTQNEDLGQVSWPGDQPSGTGELLPLGIAALITAPTALPGTRGRKFLPAMVEGNCTDSLWTSGLMTVLNAFGVAYISGFIGGTSGSAYAPGVLDKNGAFRGFIEALTTNVPAYQRRRKQGAGE